MTKEEKRSRVLNAVKGRIKKYYGEAQCGLFFNSNWFGDTMSTIFSSYSLGWRDKIVVKICFYEEYFEVFGLTTEEKKDLYDFYHKLSTGEISWETRKPLIRKK